MHSLLHCHYFSHHVRRTVLLSQRFVQSLSTVGKDISYCQKLNNRSLIRASGPDVFEFLQGLVTNDVLLLHNNPVIYAMMLNVQGRVLYDLILYRFQHCNSPAIIIECNKDIASDLMSTLHRYKLRKKVDLVNVSNNFNLHAVFSCTDHVPNITIGPGPDDILCTADPRLASLGYRLLVNPAVDPVSRISGCESSSAGYDARRCYLGVGEGIIDFPPGKCFPLECNLAFLNGVSFDKGCYIGQELTARTHYTGLIRKRIVPLILSSSKVMPGDAILNLLDKECGIVRSVSGNRALGLLRVSELIRKCSLYVPDGLSKTSTVNAVMPSWWSAGSDVFIQQTLVKKTGD